MVDVKYYLYNGDIENDALISIDGSDWIHIGEYIASETLETEDAVLIDVNPWNLLEATADKETDPGDTETETVLETETITPQLSTLKMMTGNVKNSTTKKILKKHRYRGRGRHGKKGAAAVPVPLPVEENISMAGGQAPPNEIHIEIEQFEMMEMIPTLKKAEPTKTKVMLFCTSEYEAVDIDEISMIQGDTIIFIKHEDENWSNGKNQRTGEIGLFPREYVERLI